MRGFSELGTEEGVLNPSCVRVPTDGEAGETLKESNRTDGLQITAETVGGFWDRERMDLRIALDALTIYEDDPVDEE